MQTMRYSRLAPWVDDHRPETGAALIGVDGPAGSGKSTFALNLAAELESAAVVPIDDFLSWDDLDGWWPRLEDQVLRPLLLGRPIRYQRRDWANDPLGASLAEWREVAPGRVIILERVSTCRRAIADRLTLAVWVEAPPATRLARGLARDGSALRQLWTDFMQLENSFFLADGTKQRADICVWTQRESVAGTFQVVGGRRLAELE